MARGKSKAGGCLVVLILVLAIALAAAYGLGVISHAQYVLSGEQEQGAEALDSAIAARTDAELRGRYYAYAQLDEKQKRCYRIMLDSFRSRESRAYPQDFDGSLSLIRSCIVADHPELFYVEGVLVSTTYNEVSDLVSGVAVEGHFNCSAEEAAATQEQVDQVVDAFLATVPADADDYQKAKLAYEYVVQHASYDHVAADEIDVLADGERASGQTMDDVFLRGRAVCAGYSAALQYLLQRMGIVCVQVRGNADGVGHAWCVAFLDGSYYQIDPTWGDPQFLDEPDVVDEDYINYDYLNVTDGDMAGTHQADNAFELPACTNESDNYYVRESLLFDLPDVERFGGLVSAAEGRGASSVQIRCSNEDVYRQLMDGFVVTGDLGSYVSDYEYHYTYDDVMRSITVFP